jgi:hypothetical protein
MRISPINAGRSEFKAENFSVAVAATSVDTVIGTITVPSKARARILKIGNYIGTVAAWGQITWRLRCNGIVVAPYNAILDQIGYAAQKEDAERLEFGGGSVLTVTADNASAAIVQVGVAVAWELVYQE